MNRRELLKGSLFVSIAAFFGIKGKPAGAAPLAPKPTNADPLADVEVRIQFLRSGAVPVYDKPRGQMAYVIGEDGQTFNAVTEPPRVFVPLIEVSCFKEHHLSDNLFPPAKIPAEIAETMRKELSAYLVQLVEAARADGTPVNCVIIPVLTNLTVFHADDINTNTIGWSTFMHLGMMAAHDPKAKPTGNPWADPKMVEKLPKYAGRVPKAHEMAKDICQVLGLGGGKQ